MNKKEAIRKLRKHLSDLFMSHHLGTLKLDFAEDRSFVDGYMAAIEELGLATNAELLKIIAEERKSAARRVDATCFSPSRSLPVHQCA